MCKVKPMIGMLISTILALVCSLLENVLWEQDVLSVFPPILFVAALIFGYFAFKDAVSFENKWVWACLILLFATALSDIAYLVFGDFIGVAGLIELALIVVGVIVVMLSVLHKKLVKLMPIGFAVLALGEVCGFIGFPADVVSRILMLVFYVVFALMAWGRFPAANKIFRAVVVVLAVLNIHSLGFYNALGLIILAFLLVPGFKFRLLSAEKVAAILCVITCLLSLVAFFDFPYVAVRRTHADLKEIEAELATYKTVEEYTELIAKQEKQRTTNEEQLEKARADLVTAERRLDQLCYFYYYSYYWCDSTCYPYHEQVEQLEDRIDSLKGEINRNSNEIEEAQQAIEERNQLEASLPEYREELAQAIVTSVAQTIAVLLCAAALICLAVCLFKSSYGKLAFVSCGLMVAGSVFYMFLTRQSQAFWSFDVLNYPIFALLKSYSFWSIVIFAMLAAIFAKKTASQVKFRNLAIVAVVILLLCTSGSYVFYFSMLNRLISIVYVATILCVVFALVPAKIVYDGYYSIAKHIFFSIVTFGVWPAIWVYQVTKYLNRISVAGSRSPVKELLLALFLPFYMVYWVYKTAELVEAYGEQSNKPFKISMFCLAFMFVSPLVSTVVIQDKINKIVGKPA